MLKKNMLIGLFLLLGVSVAVGQPLPQEQVDVLKKFSATLAQSQKLRTQPLLQAIDTTSKQLTYTVPTRLLTLDYEPPRIRPLALKTAEPQPVYRFYAKAGYGLPNMPYLDLNFGSGLSKEFAYNLHLKHHSASSNSVENQRFSFTGGDLNGTYFKDAFAVGGYLGYDHNVVHFYGYENSDTSEVFPRDSVRQRFSTFKAGVNLFNSTPNQGDLNYRVGLDFYTLADLYDANETGVNVFAKATKWFSKKHPLTVLIGNDLTRFDGDPNRPTNNVFYIRPNFTYHGTSFQVKVGGFLASADSTFYTLPDMEASFNLSSDKFSILAGWKGELKKNTFRSLTAYNPFINSTQNLRNTRETFYFGGLRANFVGFKAEALVGYKQFQDLALFLNDSADFKRFNVLYDNVNSVNIHGSVKFTAIKNLEIGGTVDFNTFQTDSTAQAWHLPNFELNVTAQYRIDKLLLKGEFYNAAGISYLDEAGEEHTTGAWLDLSVGAVYQFSEKFGVFLDLNNLTNQKFQRWYRYPNFGFNLLAGLTLKF